MECRAGLVGRISSASVGSVSVSTENAGATQSASWYQQTQYGSTYWAMTASFRTMRYVPGPSRNMEPWGFNRRRF